ncbi:MAG TPA: FlgD immunoglobulin-like domain containing protein [Candidatus Krumholzibacteria bacterium]|nr:FlgD immunoglobulin-like domain containing protein [Candidatus Krumholzibacteria bacterium]
MRTRPVSRFLAATISIGVFLAADPASARNVIPPADAQRIQPTVAPMDTALLGSWDFEGPGDTPDPQGWTTVDYTDQPLYFHVDDFAGMPAPYAPLSGARSLWCGIRAGVPCTYSTPPGYGNNWCQYFESIEFPASGDVHVDYLIRYDSEPSYDFTWIEYFSKTGSWRGGGYGVALSLTGEGLYTNVIPADSLAGTVTVRIRFDSDGAFSDEDGLFPTNGAVEIDSLTVWDSGGVIDFQDFESEAVGATATVDGHWNAHAAIPVGNYTALYDGDTIVQEDSLTFNHSHVWGFFNGSPDDMDCLGHPEQSVPPGPRPSDGTFRPAPTMINNAALSPVIDLGSDIDGMPVPWDAQQMLIDFDMYGDIQLPEPSHPPNHVVYGLRLSYLVDGCWRAARGNSAPQEVGGILTEATKAWVHRQYTSQPPVGATHMRFGLVAIEYKTDSGPHCHTVFPLYDNVEVRAVTTYATAAGPPPAETHLEQNIPNPFNPTTAIAYTLASAGHVRLAIYDVRGALVRVLVDRAQQPGDGPFQAEWDGRSDDGVAVSSGVYFYRLDAAGVTETRRMVLLK